MEIYKKIKKNFEGIYKACGNKFWYSCGSYLIDGKKYKYDKRMLNKQILLYNLAKKNKSILEVGVYMGHSMLLMLTSNPKLRILGLDVDERFSPKSIKYLQKKFPKSKINFILGDSIQSLKTLNKSFDLYHIDGDHRPKKIYKEIIECIRLTKKKSIKILFDDVDMMLDVEKSLFRCFKVIKFIKPNSRYRNLYVELKLNEKSIKNFKKYYYLFLFFFFPKSYFYPFIKKALRTIVKYTLGKKISYNLGKLINKNFTNKYLTILATKLKNIKN